MLRSDTSAWLFRKFRGEHRPSTDAPAGRRAQTDAVREVAGTRRARDARIRWGWI